MPSRRPSLRLTVALAAVVAILPLQALGASPDCAAPTTGGDWRSYNLDYANSRNQTEEKVISPENAANLAANWTFSSTALGGDGSIDGTPVIADGCLYVGTETGWVFALNADTGELVWKKKLASGIFASLAVEDDKVIAFESITSQPFTVGPRVAALDADSGDLLWETVVNDYLGSDLYASPVVYEGMVIVGVGANSIEGDPDFHGSIVYLDLESGEIIDRTWTIPPQVWDQGYSGGGIWSTPAIDADGYAYFGTGNPFNSAREYGTTNAIIKVDVRRSRESFGEIVATYKGLEDQVVTSQRTSCHVGEKADTGGGFLSPRFWMCEMLDLDFGASPNLYTAKDGRLVVTANQKGMVHAVDAKTMAPRWTQVVAPLILFTNAVTAAVADGVIYGSQNPPNYTYALDGEYGDRVWAAPHTGVNDIRHYEPTTVANGVVYQLDGNGIMHAYAAKDGSILAIRQMSEAVGETTVSTQSGGIAVARNTVYTAADGFVVAYNLK